MKSKDTIQHRWFEQVWNQGRVESIDELMCPDIIGHGLTDADGNEIRGIEVFKSFYKSFRGAIPDIRVTVENTVTEGEEVVALCKVTGTHTGEGLGVPPTHKRIEFAGMCMVRTRDGKICESWNCFDFLTLFQQIGVVQMPRK